MVVSTLEPNAYSRLREAHTNKNLKLKCAFANWSPLYLAKRRCLSHSLSLYHHHQRPESEFKWLIICEMHGDLKHPQKERDAVPYLPVTSRLASAVVGEASVLAQIRAIDSTLHLCLCNRSRKKALLWRWRWTTGWLVSLCLCLSKMAQFIEHQQEKLK